MELDRPMKRGQIGLHHSKFCIKRFDVTILHYAACFFAGLFLCNSIPHLTAGLRGEPFPSPFAKPPGQGHSSALVNFLWGTSNLFVGIVLFLLVSFVPGWNMETALAAIAFLLIGIPMSRHFEKVRLSRPPGKDAN
jgi:hypothetical protein